MTARDVNGAALYHEDDVRDLARGRDVIVRIVSVLPDGKVFLSSGVTTRSERVEVVL